MCKTFIKRKESTYTKQVFHTNHTPQKTKNYRVPKLDNERKK